MEDIDVDGSCSPYRGKLISSRPIWETNDNDNTSVTIRQVREILSFYVIENISFFFRSLRVFHPFQSFNPMSEPMDDEWPCKFDASIEAKHEFAFPCGMACEDDDEDTEMKIRAFLDEKVVRYLNKKFIILH